MLAKNFVDVSIQKDSLSIFDLKWQQKNSADFGI